MKAYSNRAGTTIRTGAELERAAAMYAREPIPSMVLKSNGTALPADRIAKACSMHGDQLDAIAAQRSSMLTLNLQTVGFDPEKLQLNQLRVHTSQLKLHVLAEFQRITSMPKLVHQ